MIPFGRRKILEQDNELKCWRFKDGAARKVQNKTGEGGINIQEAPKWYVFSKKKFGLAYYQTSIYVFENFSTF